jgi:hypothetical protein
MTTHGITPEGTTTEPSTPTVVVPTTSDGLDVNVRFDQQIDPVPASEPTP